MREIKFDIIFWDGADKDTIEHYTLQQAIGEDFVEFKDNEMIAPDECTIIRQYTGLKDKNGKEIYEGDIIEVTEGKSKYRSEVVFVGTSFCLVNRKCCKNCAEGTGCIGSLDELMGEYKVIGNIYENGELLNG